MAEPAQLAIRLPRKLYQRIKVESVRRDVSISQLTAEAFGLMFRTRRSNAAAKELDRLTALLAKAQDAVSTLRQAGG